MPSSKSSTSANSKTSSALIEGFIKLAKIFFSGGFGFQIVGLSSFVSSFQFSFLPLVKALVNFGL